jgi:hypothetical protein
VIREIDNYFLQQHEPIKSYLLALRGFILDYDDGITEAWRYSMPFFCYNGKRFCYLWVHKKYNQPYLGVVEGKKITHPRLIAEKRARMKIMLFDPEKDIPVKTIRSILGSAISLCT